MSTPVLDANGDPVLVFPGTEINDAYRLFMSGRVPAACGHYIAQSEARAGFTSCERCPTPPEGDEDDETCRVFVQWDDRDPGAECGQALPCPWHDEEDENR